MESLTIYGTPDQVDGIPIRFEVISLWERSEDEPCKGTMFLSQISPTGERTDPLEVDIDLSKSHFHRTRILIQGLKISGVGRYRFLISVKEDSREWLAAELPILVNFEMPSVTVS